jgi:uncharacterized membrane protein
MKLNYLTIIIIVLIAISSQIFGQSFTWIGTLGGESSIAYAISNDGSVVVGQIVLSSGENRAVKWTPSGGLTILNGLQNINSWARAVSADGSVIVGTAQENTWLAFRCIQNNPFEYLLPLGGSDFNESYAYDLSSDGTKIVGRMKNLSWEGRGFVWTESSGMKELGTLLSMSTTPSSGVNAISGNGDFLVGYSSYSDVYLTYSAVPAVWVYPPFYNIQELPYFLLMQYGRAEGISENGNYVVGVFNINGRLRGQRWHYVPPNQWFYRDIGLLDGVPDYAGNCYALDVSNDGIVVGQTPDLSPEGSAAYLWEAITTQSSVMHNLNELYSNLINQSGYLISANAITPDSRLIAGYGYRLSTRKYEGFVLDRGPITNVEAQKFSPKEFSLDQNYPNPFNPSTSIQYAVGNRQFVQLKVYDILGNEVATLVNEEKAPGTYEVEFNSHSDGGQNLPAGRQGLSSGVYFYRMQAGDFVETKKMILLR